MTKPSLGQCTWWSTKFFFRVVLANTIIRPLVLELYSCVFHSNLVKNVSFPGSSIFFSASLLCLCHAFVYYLWGGFLKYAYEKTTWFKQSRVSRPATLGPQEFDFKIGPTIWGEMVGAVVVYIQILFMVGIGDMDMGVPSSDVSAWTRLQQAYTFQGRLSDAGWYLLMIVWADACFFFVHWFLHKHLYWIHKDHHHYRSSISYSAEYKSLIEGLIVGCSELLPFLVYSKHISHLLTWTIIGTMYNEEGHSGFALLFIENGFHDLHHSLNCGNYGIASYLDAIFGTLIEPSSSMQFLPHGNGYAILKQAT